MTSLSFSVCNQDSLWSHKEISEASPRRRHQANRDYNDRVESQAHRQQDCQDRAQHGGTAVDAYAQGNVCDGTCFSSLHAFLAN